MKDIRPLTIDLEGQRVKAHRNLKNGLWSVLIKVDGREKVVGHVSEVNLTDVTFHVREGGRQRVITEKCKNVHAFAIGIFTARNVAEGPQLTGITYNPYKVGHFYQEADETPIFGASQVRLAGTKASATINEWYQVFSSPLPQKRDSMAAMNPNWYDYREVACPECQANAGSYCKRPSGHSGPFVQPHKPRQTAAHIIWRAEEVEKYGHQLTTWDDDEKPAETPVIPLYPASAQLDLFAAAPAVAKAS